ncbi:hypothetical protein FHG87_015089 [Trinorchestia longiramus]|nr:hypothetical protein FHG87_015089 [Trinorchestia longiramus]
MPFSHAITPFSHAITPFSHAITPFPHAITPFSYSIVHFLHSLAHDLINLVDTETVLCDFPAASGHSLGHQDSGKCLSTEYKSLYN